MSKPALTTTIAACALVCTLTCAFTCALFAAPVPTPAAGAEAGECEPETPTFGFCHLDMTFEGQDGSIQMQAGSHPFAQTITIDPLTEVRPGLGKIPSGQPRELVVELPPGLVGDRDATPRCDAAHFSTPVIYAGGAAQLPDCPDGAVLGLARLRGSLGGPELEVTTPVYNLEPPPGVALRLGLRVNITGAVTIDARLNESPPYNVIATTPNITQMQRFYGADVTLWGNPAAPAHDDDRGICGGVLEVGEFEGQDLGDFLGLTCPVSITQRPFITLPRSCTGPLETVFEAVSWEGIFARETILTHDEAGRPLGTWGCDRLGFAQDLATAATSRSASSPTGFDLDLEITDEGLANPSEEAIAASDIKEAVVTLPEGVRANPSLAAGLAVCSAAQFARERSDSGFGEGCPAASKIGSVQVRTPLLRGVLLEGSLFVATPDDPSTAAPENPFDTLIALYMTVKEPERGINVGLPVKVEPDPRTGQLIATLPDIPQTPVSHFHLHLREGGRSPLITPPLCGTYETEALLTPWSDPGRPQRASASFSVDHGVGGGPCPPPGTPPFEPGLTAGSLSNQAGAHAPFTLRLTRRDGDQDLTRFSAVLPPGMSAKLAGVGKCPDAQIAAAGAKSGKAELASPSCPDASYIGTAAGGAGVGSQLTYVPGRVYLAGPYNGAPLSVVAIVPAVAGPFDVGVIVTRFALRIDPVSARVTVDGERSDPIPHILKGIPLAVRDIRATVDRADFTLNPTSCERERVAAEIWGGGADPFSLADDASLTRTTRFQAAGCRGLGFKPRLGLRLKGGTRRGAFPALRFRYRPRAGDANLSRLALRFPRSEFIEQGHFRTICTRVRFRAGQGNGANCPKGSIYGHVKVYTPLLEAPLRGPVFLRSSNHNLPDVVLALHGPPAFPVDFEVATRIDSVRGGLRAIASATPDVPVSRVALNMQGGKKGLFVNSTDICRKPHRARVHLSAHSGAERTLRPLLRAQCGKRRARRR